MKKFNNIYIGALGALLMFSACNKQLDLNPHQSIDQNKAILTAQDVQSTLVGAYNRMGLSDLYGGGVFVYPDLMATQTDVSFNGTFQGLTQMADQAILIDNTFVSGTWQDAYQVINQTNNVLANLSKVASGDKDRTEGEAKFLRGLVYFDLARLFGKDWNDGDPNTNPGVPIVLTPTVALGPDSYVARATVAATYAQAIADLTDAEAKMPETNSFYATKYSAAAILARLYLQQGNYAKAATEANTVIASGAFELNTNYAAEFPNPGGVNPVHIDNTPEDVFAIQVTSQQGTNSLNTYYASKTYAGRGDIHVNDNFTDIYGATDTRAALYQYDDPTDNTTTFRCRKFDNSIGNVHVIRLAELYLIRAESNFRNGSSIGATPLADVNTIRARAKATPLTAVNVDAPTQLADSKSILDERIRELAFEGGFFLHDGKRIQQSPIGAVPYNSNKLVFPIPKQDINANPKLKQNPGYGAE
ncbi:RagB/SusD family nutrient uptake outer membrane protein [Mucilaginibacter sp. BJC16-A38]|uniref:RagB/SusD family nutrient uptake outer membrane protein n=1 Tax=Mucilaginibacter phenanthrenivorans TaxID=1234842 RepID=UPI0021581162|nr:RagB/SusD family nutrient uptake outer membrane protein [Mucilaginibacter phenanthrenivorans]MCR8556277.1 RagB/SusD family nutrient uptake outer membrane protein [Mucilaginibacter phenanthrenivorans]